MLTVKSLILYTSSKTYYLIYNFPSFIDIRLNEVIKIKLRSKNTVYINAQHF